MTAKDDAPPRGGEEDEGEPPAMMDDTSPYSEPDGTLRRWAAVNVLAMAILVLAMAALYVPMPILPFIGVLAVIGVGALIAACLLIRGFLKS